MMTYLISMLRGSTTTGKRKKGKINNSKIDDRSYKRREM